MIVWLFYSILFVAVAAFWIIFGAGSQLSMHVVVLLCRRQLFPMFFLQIAHCYKHKSKMSISKKKKNQQTFLSFYDLVMSNFECANKVTLYPIDVEVLKRGTGALCKQLWPRGTFCAEKWRTFFRLNCLRIRATATFLK